jgi:hypothetical protein
MTNKTNVSLTDMSMMDVKNARISKERKGRHMDQRDLAAMLNDRSFSRANIWSDSHNQAARGRD